MLSSGDPAALGQMFAASAAENIDGEYEGDAYSGPRHIPNKGPTGRGNRNRRQKGRQNAGPRGFQYSEISMDLLQDIMDDKVDMLDV